MYALQADFARGLIYPFVALAHGFVLFILIQTVGRVSGAHFNPAVTLGLLSIRRISLAHAAGYWIVQCLGSIAAALLAKALIPDLAHTVNYAANAVNNDISTGAALVLEAIFTFFLVWTIIGTAVDPDGPADWAPLAISSALALGVLLIAPITGASLNPARSLGPALISGHWGSFADYVLPYVVGPLVGGLLAAMLYSGIFFTGRNAGPAPSPPASVPDPPAPAG
jgi:MIP family channel proteins